MFGDQPGGDGQPVIEKGRIDAALEALPGIAGQHQLLAGAGDILRREIGAFDQHLGGFRLGAGLCPAHDPADIVRTLVVGDHRHRLVETIFLVVERGQRLAGLGLARDQPAIEPGHVIDMQRPPEIEHHEIGDVDQQADRLLAGGFEMALHPGRGAAVGDAADAAGVEGGTAVRVLGAHIGTGAGSLHGQVCTPIGIRKRPQRAHAGRRQIARNPAHAHAVLPVGGDRYVEHRIVEFGIVGVAGANFAGCIFRQFDDPVMVVAQLQLAIAAHHAETLDIPDFCGFQREIAARNIGPGRPENPNHPGLRIRRAAHHLPRLRGTIVNFEQLQFIGIRMRPRLEHFRHAKGPQRIGGIFHAFDFKTDAGQLLGNFSRACFGIEMGLEPA